MTDTGQISTFSADPRSASDIDGCLNVPQTGNAARMVDIGPQDMEDSYLDDFADAVRPTRSAGEADVRQVIPCSFAGLANLHELVAIAAVDMGAGANATFSMNEEP